MKRNYENIQATEQFRALSNNLSNLPFSFVYGGKEYKGFSSENFALISKNVIRSGEKETQNFRFAFLKALEITLSLTHYFSHGVTEWTIWFENTTEKNSDVIENIKTELNFVGKYPVLKGILGDHVNQYSPYSIDLQNNMVEFSEDLGRATHINFPYFNLEYGDGGVMLAIGWAGTWNARFSSKDNITTYTATSVNGLKTYLKPGEKIRTALFVIAPYSVRNEHYATNYWRDWYVKYNLPKADKSGKELQPFSTCYLAVDSKLQFTDGSMNEYYFTWKPSLEKMIEENVKVDYRWLDAGWYVRPDRTSPGLGLTIDTNWWASVGTWKLDPEKWPGNTLLEATDFARANGMKTLMWFEPERVTDPENLEKNFGYKREWAIEKAGLKLESVPSTIANNIGDPSCLNWTLNQICSTLRENKVELYREDCNVDAAPLWRQFDQTEGENRSGITESKFVDGHYKLWDGIIECTCSYGGCGFVDSCASGGGRNDLESMRRGVPLLRSDSDRTTTALRLSMTTAFNKWIPFCGASSTEKEEELDVKGSIDKYIWRASYLPALKVSGRFTQDPNLDFDMLRFGINEWKKVSPYLLKEFYVLTPWHHGRDNSDFTAFCYYDPETEKGILFAFRQEGCYIKKPLNVILPFINTGEKYRLTDEDSKQMYIVDGHLELRFSSELCIKDDKYFKPSNGGREAKLLWIERVNNI